MHGIICGPACYKYKEFYFEIHSYFGPHPLNKDGNPKANITADFWIMWDEFKLFSPEEREKYRDGGLGGCVAF